MTPRQRFVALLDGRPLDRLIVDVGTTTLTGLRPSTPPRFGATARYADEIMHLPILSETELSALGAHSRRCGAVYRGARLDEDDVFTDRDGVRWIWAEGEPAPLDHPLANSSFRAISATPNRAIPEFVFPSSLNEPDRPYVLMADAPCAGLLDSAFRLRGYFELLEDTVDRWPEANALFDRAMDAIIRDYQAMLEAAPGDPDIIVYGDDLAYQTDLYLSEERFAFFLRPRMARIFSAIRSQTRAHILFHSCGASLPVLKEVAAMNVRILNFQPTAAGMSVAAVRKALGPGVIFHGVLDFVALANALDQRDWRSVDRLLDDIVAGWPMIAAPADNLPVAADFDRIRRVTHFLENLNLPALLRGDRTEALAPTRCSMVA